MGDQDATDVVQFVQLAYQHVRPCLSITLCYIQRSLECRIRDLSGWLHRTRHFSKVRASKHSRAAFADTMENLLNTYSLGGRDSVCVRDPSVDLVISTRLAR
jgi:hypothetical protein